MSNHRQHRCANLLLSTGGNILYVMMMFITKLLCLCSVVELQEYYDEHGEYGFRPSRETIEHPNGKGRVEKRVLQASLLHELRLPINLV